MDRVSPGIHWTHSKNGGMIFIPIEYDIYPNEFHTYGMNSASMTFILATVRSSYRGWFFIPKLRVNFTPCRVIRSKVKQVMEGKSIHMRPRNF